MKEMNFDGLIGPTHNYGGLSTGNLASKRHERSVSHPKKAALQALEKMKFLHDLGVPQGIFPPHERPHIETLRALGFEGTDYEIIETAFKQAPNLFLKCCSASSMWAANSATATPSCDAKDGLCHLTPANLPSMFHRSIEGKMTERILKKIFSDENLFMVHPPLPMGLADEGSANHTRLCTTFDTPGLHLFTYGDAGSSTFPARQNKEASEAIARLHRIPKDKAIFLKQSPEAIDAGVFHNDVIAVGHKNLLLYHEKAYTKMPDLNPFTLVEIKEKDFSLQDAVNSYLFNSQIVTLPNGKTALIAPLECQEMTSAKRVLENLLENQFIDELYFIDVRESMQNGGGPACLRLRVVLSDKERFAIHPGVIFTYTLYESLKSWINNYYRDSLILEDLGDPAFLDEVRLALDALTVILKMDSLYSFQRQDSA